MTDFCCGASRRGGDAIDVVDGGRTPLAAAALAVESVALAAIFARYSLALTATNPLVWVIGMGRYDR